MGRSLTVAARIGAFVDVSLCNWAGNQTYSAARVHRPDSVEALREIVRRSGKIRALGTRHSFNDIADTDGELISTERLNRVLGIDAAKTTVRVEAGARYGELAQVLHRQGWALHNLASLPHISVGGAIATATHGSGMRLGNLATAVMGFELVNAQGEIEEFSQEKDREALDGMVVHLGAMGILTAVELRMEPEFAVRQSVFENLPREALLRHHAEIFAAAYSVSLFTDWGAGAINQAWLKERGDASGTAAEPRRDFFGATPAVENRHPLPGISAEHCTEQMGVAGPWHERLPHFRLDFTPSGGAELQSEYFVAFEYLPRAMEALGALAPEIAELLLISELRAIAADTLWMSPCYERASAAIHFTWKPEEKRVRELLPKIEAALEPFAPRPHWGKLFTLAPENIRGRYPRWKDFAELMRKRDPGGKFQNEFVERLSR